MFVEHRTKPRFSYAIVVAAVAFVVLLTAAAMNSSSGALIPAILRQTDWSRNQVSFAAGLGILFFGLTGPFAAAIQNTIGIRATLAIGLVMAAFGMGISGLAEQPWQFILARGVLVGIGTGMTSLSLAATIANRWFEQRRGLVMGLLTASNATGQLIFLPAVASMAENHGWRSATHFLLGLSLLGLIPVVFLVRNHPRDVGQLPYGATEPPAEVPRDGHPFRSAVSALFDGFQSRDFWLLAATFFICGASTNGLIGTHLISACGDHGIPEVRAAGLLAAMGIFDLVGTTLSGWLTDRFDSRYLLTAYYGFRGLSLLALPFALSHASWTLGVFAVFYGLDWIATVPPTVRLASNAFGPQRAGVMFGWIAAFHQVGASLATITAGSVRTVTGVYDQAFFGAGLMCLGAALLALRIGAARLAMAV
ncbi:MFS transporter [Fimbriimonas ginsengisoli]|uniref:Putative membrane transport protein n=1 Tax=Fimbriimonas ginsengisoli Gsoil 348 TaxID=661478 RepID=A0A068NKC8_FIMGI|nr:MFS transporter [Fimbriimonas ginsengisoli]AIE83946.1 putative membrane transport protein [Fimbriimonas ginsengisoli Gsoil 348]